MPNIEDAVLYMEAIARDNSHGYAQDRRNGKPDFDCSSLVGKGLNVAGFKVSPSSTTRNLHDQLIACGFQDIPITATRMRGDIFLTPGKHVVMCVDANNIVHASINEHGGINNGIPGDQTGKEICIRSFYNPSYKWKHHMRYDGISSADAQPISSNSKPTLKKGSRGEYVLAWQKYLNTLGYGLAEDGIFGNKTEAAVKDYQKKRGLIVDGIIGPCTWATLEVNNG